jgi:hypothetical protein
MYTYEELRLENEAFAGTAGVSENNCFLPAFREARTGRVELARFEDGVVAPVHVLCGVPEEWVVERDHLGQVVAVVETVVAGFLRRGVFYTREEAAALS